MTREANPFEVLRLDPTTPNEEIVRAAARLRQRATDDATVSAIRQAVHAITASAEARRLHELLTYPGPRYDWPAAHQLAAAFWRSPCPEPEPAGEVRAEDLLFDSRA
jgi:hypothetical protein